MCKCTAVQAHNEDGDVGHEDRAPIVGRGRLSDKYTVEDKVPKTKLDAALCRVSKPLSGISSENVCRFTYVLPLPGPLLVRPVPLDVVRPQLLKIYVKER